MSVLMFLNAGKLSDRFNELTLSKFGITLCIGIILVTFSRDFAIFAFSAAMFGLGIGMINPVSRAAVLKLSSAKRGFYAGLYESISTADMAMGAFLGGALADYVSLESPYHFASILALTVFLILVILSKKKG